MVESYLIAAQRHFEDAELLRRETRLDNAGHHYGVAGECAVKAVCVEEAGIRPPKHFDSDPNRDLRGAAVPNLAGRKGQRILAILPTLFVGWSVHDRYSATGQIQMAQVEQWRSDAEKALNLMQGL
jgi:hypothetical protein